MATPQGKAAPSIKGGSPQSRDTILLLHRPNLDLLGTHAPEVYGHETLPALNPRCGKQAPAAGAALMAFQSNHEGALIERVHAARAEHALPQLAR